MLWLIGSRFDNGVLASNEPVDIRVTSVGAFDLIEPMDNLLSVTEVDVVVVAIVVPVPVDIGLSFKFRSLTWVPAELLASLEGGSGVEVCLEKRDEDMLKRELGGRDEPLPFVAIDSLFSDLSGWTPDWDTFLENVFINETIVWKGGRLLVAGRNFKETDE
jgi:hypothetical protein